MKKKENKIATHKLYNLLKSQLLQKGDTVVSSTSMRGKSMYVHTKFPFYTLELIYEPFLICLFYC